MNGFMSEIAALLLAFAIYIVLPASRTSRIASIRSDGADAPAESDTEPGAEPSHCG